MEVEKIWDWDERPLGVTAHITRDINQRQPFYCPLLRLRTETKREMFQRLANAGFKLYTLADLVTKDRWNPQRIPHKFCK